MNLCESSEEKQLFAGLPANLAGKEHVSCMLLSSFGKDFNSDSKVRIMEDLRWIKKSCLSYLHFLEGM